MSAPNEPLSIVWVMILQRAAYHRRAKKLSDNFEKHFWSGVDLVQLYRQGNENASSHKVLGIETIFRAGFKEFSRLRQQENMDHDTIMEGTQRAMRVARSREQEALEANLPFLASVASVSPYVGLFGTVWDGSICRDSCGIGVQQIQCSGRCTIASIRDFLGRIYRYFASSVTPLMVLVSTQSDLNTYG